MHLELKDKAEQIKILQAHVKNLENRFHEYHKFFPNLRKEYAEAKVNTQEHLKRTKEAIFNYSGKKLKLVAKQQEDSEQDENLP